MTHYREILRLGLNPDPQKRLSQSRIAQSCCVSKSTVSHVLKRAGELGLKWPLADDLTDVSLGRMLYPSEKDEDKPDDTAANKKMPDLERIHKELLRQGVNKKLLWTEYLEECNLEGKTGLRYSQFCYYIQQDEAKRNAAFHKTYKPGEQVEVDWAGDPLYLQGAESGRRIPVYLFVGVLSYSLYPFAEAFINEKTSSWIKAHNDMFHYFGGVTKIIVPDNTKTAVVHGKAKPRKFTYDDPELNAVYHNLAEHYDVAILPARVRAPRDKNNVEAAVGFVSTWITAALRDEQFFTIEELNKAIHRKLEKLADEPFEKREGSRHEVFLNEEKPYLYQLPATPFEVADWKQATVQYNYHIFVEGMYYSVPYQYIGKKVDVRVTATMIEVYAKSSNDQTRIASHKRLYGRKGQYSTVKEHMPENHQHVGDWSGDRFRRWAERIGPETYKVIDGLLTSARVEQQAYRGCMGILKLSEKYSNDGLEKACAKALSYSATPTYRVVCDVIESLYPKKSGTASTAGSKSDDTSNSHGITRGADYYRRS